MKLGIVGMLPDDFRTHEPAHLEAISELGFTGAGFHFPGELAGEIVPADIERELKLFSDHGIDLVQCAVTYRECLFDPNTSVRKAVARKIVKTAEIAAALDAHCFLIRPGSLNPRGAWTPHPDNHTPEAWALLIDTLKKVVPNLENHGVTAVMETHVVSILKDPETCRRLIDEIGSPSLRLVMDYVNHFESLSQVYDNRNRLDHVFSEVGASSPVMHIKDIAIGPGLVVHLDETVPGNGELDLTHCFQHFENLFPEGYGLIEHLKPDLIPEAAQNTRAILSEAGINVL
ncbi:MAG: sugar phosphate isomerase/epimerase family protein [Candidatus Latescibacterota bacterium]|nr:sugar phosphate isomerase/epimerase family protein [Candidatus Latescibacterota bacterium]